MSSMFRLFIVAFGLFMGLHGIVVGEQKKQSLEAGPGQRPFDVTRHSVPVEEIIGGGPPKDGIPALDYPKFVSAKEAEKFLSPRDRILGIEFNGVAKAYPIKILNWHEIVNDDFAGKPVTVTW